MINNGFLTFCNIFGTGAGSKVRYLCTPWYVQLSVCPPYLSPNTREPCHHVLDYLLLERKCFLLTTLKYKCVLVDIRYVRIVMSSEEIVLGGGERERTELWRMNIGMHICLHMVQTTKQSSTYHRIHMLYLYYITRHSSEHNEEMLVRRDLTHDTKIIFSTCNLFMTVRFA